jgi:chorismate mutase / prephenate dehydratase
MSERTIEDLRKVIDHADRQILQLINERMTVAQQIGRLKAAEGHDIVDMRREEEILRRLASWNPGPLPEKTLRAIYREIFSGSRMLQTPVKVSFLGPPGTYCHEAALERFGHSASFLPCSTVAEIFEEVSCGGGSFGVVPVENSIEGSVRETLDTLMVSPVGVCGEIALRIRHVLMNCTGKIEDIHAVASHPQALAQCRQWLSSRFPGLPQLECSSTAAAAEKALDDLGIAVIGSEGLAKRLGLRVIKAGIQDRAENITRFYVLGNVKPAATGRDKTSLVFWTEDRPGSLFTILEKFARYGINLSRIESRPDRGGMPWKYAFFVDLEGHRDDRALTECLQDLSGRDTLVKILGSFPSDL